MVVLGIIGVLVALSIGAVMRIQTVQQIRSSSDVVEKVQVAVDNQYKALIAQAQTDMRNQSQDATALINYFNGDTDSALALLTYCRVRQSFPQTFAEVQTLPTVLVNGQNIPYFTVGGAFFQLKSQFAPFANAATMPSTNLTPSQQSAALLYAAVAQTGAGGSTFASDEALTSAHFDFQVPGSVTIHVYKDAWNQPIGYCRFGTNSELQNPPYANTTIPPGATIPYIDPLDPAGKLYNWANNSGAASKAQATTFAATLFLNNGDLANATWFDASNRRPVVYSTGYNLLYESLNNTTNTTPGKGGLDDILGYRLTQLGQRGTK
jgi:hypothetical protein